LLLSTAIYENTVLHYAALNGTPDKLQKIWDMAKCNLTREEIKHKLLLSTNGAENTAWRMAAEEGKLEALKNMGLGYRYSNN
jgi:hypothetical protein